jgi:hypothetical protein
MEGTAMAGTLTITLRTPDAKAMRQYRYLWLVERDGSTLGWGHSHRRYDAETEAWDLVTTLTSPDEFEIIEIV